MYFERTLLELSQVRAGAWVRWLECMLSVEDTVNFEDEWSKSSFVERQIGVERGVHQLRGLQELQKDDQNAWRSGRTRRTHLKVLHHWSLASLASNDDSAGLLHLLRRDAREEGRMGPPKSFDEVRSSKGRAGMAPLHLMR